MSGKQFAIVLSITFFVGMVWLVSDIIFNTKPSIPTSPKLEVLLQPVNPGFNSRVIELINKEVIDTKLTTQPQPTPQEVPIASQSATQSAQPGI